MADALSPTIVPLVVALVGVFALGIVLLVALGLERGPDPAEVAVAYERAWDALDFDLLWHLSAPELRDDRSRGEFVEDKRAAYAARSDLRGLLAEVEVEQLDRAGMRARAVTRVRLRDGGTSRHEVRLRRHAGRWAVDAYRLGADTTRSESPSAPTP